MRETLITEYGQVGQNFRLLTETRFKLLAFLPIASGAAVALVTRIDATVPTLAFSVFGLTVTVALVTYNVRNDQLYDTLVARAASLERRLGDPDGAFANRPRPWLSMAIGRVRWPVNHRFAIGAIYLASIGIWVFGVLNSISLLIHQYLIGGTPPMWLGVTMFVTAVTAIIASGLLARRRRNNVQNHLRQAAAETVSRIARRPGQDDFDFNAAALNDPVLLRLLAELGGTTPNQMRPRILYLCQLTPSERRFYIRPNSATWTAAQTVAYLTDLAPEWLYDCAMRRRLNISAIRRDSLNGS